MDPLGLLVEVRINECAVYIGYYPRNEALPHLGEGIKSAALVHAGRTFQEIGSRIKIKFHVGINTYAVK